MIHHNLIINYNIYLIFHFLNAKMIQIGKIHLERKNKLNNNHNHKKLYFQILNKKV